MNTLTKATLLLVAGGLTPNVSAELLKISYTDTNQAIRNINPTDAYIGNHTGIQFALSAGVERVVQITIKNQNNETIKTLTSEKLGPADRITVDGNEYYGSLLNVGTINEGKYKLAANILSSTGNVISSEQYDLTIDTTAPTLGKFSWAFPYGRGTAKDGLPKFSHTDDRHFTLEDIHDELSPINKVIYKTYWESNGKEGQLYKTGEVNYLPNSNKAMLGTGGNNSNAAVFFPSNTQSKHKVVFEVSDIAGNVASKEMYFYNNSKCGPTPKIAAIEDPTYSGQFLGEVGFRPVTSKTPINKNPLEAIYRVEKEYYAGAEGASEFAGKPVGITNRGLVAVDDTYAYFKIHGPANTHNNFNWPNSGWTNDSTWRCSSLSFPNPEFSDETLPPKITNLEAYIDNIGWVGRNYKASGLIARDTKISKIRVTADKRAYEQTITMYGNSCNIVVGESECVLDANLSFNKSGTVGYYHTRPALRSAENSSMYDSTTSHVWEWDAQEPIINDIIEHDEAQKKLSFDVTELKSGNTWNRVKLTSAGLRIIKDGVEVENLAASSIVRAGNNYTATVNYSNLGHGSYKLIAWAKDNYANYVEKELLSIENDIEPPVLAFSIENGATIKSLDDIKITVNDDNESRIKSVNLKGGPANENVYLAVSETSEGKYSLEYPVLFPDENSNYYLTAIAQDSAGNEVVKEVQFNYVAEIIGLDSGLSEITLPATGSVFKDVNGNLPLYSKQIKLSDGSIISGKYPIFVTLRSDSEGSVFINNKEITPGSTVTVDYAYDFGLSDGRYDLDLVTKQNTFTKGSLLIASSAPNSPVLITNYKFSGYKGTKQVNTSPYAITDKFELNYRLGDKESNYCNAFTSSLDEVLNSDTFKDRLCYVQMNIEGAKQRFNVSASEAKLSSYLVSLEDQFAEFKVSVVGYNSELFTLFHDKIEVTPRDPKESLSTTLEYKDDIIYHKIQEVEAFVSMNNYEGCTLTANVEEAKEHAFDKVGADKTPLCLVEWVNFPSGLVEDKKTGRISGFTDTLGTTTFDWQIKIFFNENESLPISVGSKTVDIVEPIEPKLNGTTIEFSSGLISSSSNHLLRDSTAIVKGITFNLEPRLYKQIVTFNGESCAVDSGFTKCALPVSMGTFGDKTIEMQGNINLEIDIDSERSYFADKGMGQFTNGLNWDYTPPQLFDVVINNKNDGSLIETTLGDKSVEAQQDEILVIIKSPFTGITEDETWKLQDPALKIEEIEDIRFQQSVKIDNNTFYFSNSKQNLNEDNRLPPIKTELVGDYIVYHYSMTPLSDGAFKFSLNLRDAYENGTDYENPIFYLQRFAPEVQLTYLRDKSRSTNPFYFASDFGAVTNPGWDTHNEIFEATFGGVSLNLVDDPVEPKSYIKFFDGNLESLTPGETYELVVKAKDSFGNIGQFKENYVFAPSKFAIKSKDTGTNDIYQYIQRGTLYIYQSQYLCNFVASKALAEEISRDARKGCYVQLDNLPKGMDAAYQGWAMTVTGSVHDALDNTVNYSAYVVNTDGSEVRVANGQFEYNVKQTEEMTFDLSPTVELDDGVYGVIPENPVLARYKLDQVAGELNVNIKRGQFESSQYMAQRSHKPIYELMGIIRDDDVDKRTVFDRYPLEISAAYSLSEEHMAGATGEVIVLPSRKVAINLNMNSERNVLSTDVVEVTAYMGEWDWKNKLNKYDSNTMGEWDIYLAYKNNRGEEQIITDIQTNDENGQAKFTVAIADIFRKSNGFYAVAEVKSPHKEYEKKIISTPIFMRIVLGTGVSGDLKSSQVSGKVPFTTLVRYDYDTIEDMVAGNDTKWEVSQDLQNWTQMEEYQGRNAIPFLMQSPGDMYVRATVTNKNTTETSVSSPLKISGYNKASLLIKGPAQVYEGQEFKLNMLDYNTPLDSYDGQAQWSEDEGETWYEGSPVQSFIAKGEQALIIGRFRFSSTTDAAGDKAWSEARYYARPVAPRPVMAQIQAPHLVEMGTTIDVHGQVLNLNGGVDLPIKYEWLLPNGDVTHAESFEYTPTALDLDENNRLSFTLRAWVDGYKEETYREAKRNLESWVYEFPETSIDIRSNILVSPANITGMILQKHKFMPGVSYTYEWLESDNIEITNPTRMYTNLLVKTPGVHELKAKVTDSRGTVKVVSKFIDVLEADPVEGKLVHFPSNRYSRAPLGLVARAQTSGGHPRDYIVNYRWFINDEEIEVTQPRSPMNRFEIAEAGTYDIKVIATSLYGQETVIKESYEVFENKKPQCESTQLERSGTIRITASCKDEDGYVVGYDWWFNGEYVGRGAASTQLRLSEYPTMNITYEAVDDAGGRTKGTFSW